MVSDKENILFVELFQPFAQYRNPFTFYYAQCYPLPPRSTIIGMLQNATDSYYDEDFWNLKISLHGGFENTFWNYQNLIKGDIKFVTNNTRVELWNQERPLYGNTLKSQRTPIYQQELYNGHLFLFIKGGESLINEIKESLQHPRKVLSLGRSEDVIFITKEPQEIKGEVGEVKKNIWLKFPMYIQRKSQMEHFPIKNEKYPVFSIPSKVIFENDGKAITTKGELTKNTHRDVKFVPVIYTGYDYAVYLKEGIEVEYYSVNEKTFKIPVVWGWIGDD